VSLEDFNKFCVLFAERHPDIEQAFKQQKFQLINGSIFRDKPAKMSEDIYSRYFRFLKRWYMANGYMEYEPDLVYVFLPASTTARAIDTATIRTIEPVTLELTKLTIQKKGSDIIEAITINENFEFFTKRAYIF